MKEITFPLRVMNALGATELVMSSAVGGMNPHLDRGDIVVLTDFINLMGDNPLIGWNDDRLGPRFPDMSEPFDRRRRAAFEAVALDKGISVRRAVLVAVAGPNLETAAEYRFLSRIGADVVGMSTVPETIVGVQCGMKILSLSIVTDLCPADNLQPADIKEIIETAEAAEPRLRELVTEYLVRL
jgi:purine-nucleoside phosphorylase